MHKVLLCAYMHLPRNRRLNTYKKHWPFAHHNLAMVGGANKLCSYLADSRQAIRVEVVASQHPLSLSGYGLLTKTYSNLFYGADYDATGFENFHRSVWICPVTLFVLGRYITSRRIECNSDS